MVEGITVWQLLGLGALLVAAVMSLLWWLGWRTTNYSYVDLGWSANFVLLAFLYGSLGEGDGLRRLLICSMFALWGGRLAWHLAGRIMGHPEEGRYVQLRAEWGAKGALHARFFGFFQLQAGLNVLLGLPMLVAVLNPAPELSIWEIAGLAVWIVALGGETIADAQLKKFKANPAHRGRVCDVGLWGWSRHPNYFFEWTIWIGYALFALGSPGGIWCLALPVLMLHFLINVTGIKATEEQALRSKGEAYRDYQRRVSAFIPLPPRRTS